MSMHPQDIHPIPEETARIARAALPRGNTYMTMRDQLGTLYEDRVFAALFPKRGRPAEAPWQLALVCVFQFIEGLSDRQAASAVRTRIDWKYALGLELADPGFDFSVLSKFRSRLIAGSAEMLLLERMLEHFKPASTPQASWEATNRLHSCARRHSYTQPTRKRGRNGCRATLNAVASVAPEWLREHAELAWFDRYGHRIEESRLPKGQAERQQYAELIGTDGSQLLSMLYEPSAPAHLKELPAVQILRQSWVFQYYTDEGQLRWRKAEDLPPAGMRYDSPYDPEAHYGNKRSITWTGYKVHVTETCDDDELHVITHIETTPAGLTDSELAAPIHDALAKKALLPGEHFLDSGYVDADLLVKSQRDLGVEVIGPVRPDSRGPGTRRSWI